MSPPARIAAALRRWLPGVAPLAACAAAGGLAFLVTTHLVDLSTMPPGPLAAVGATTGMIGGIICSAWLRRPRPPRRRRRSAPATR